MKPWILPLTSVIVGVVLIVSAYEDEVPLSMLERFLNPGENFPKRKWDVFGSKNSPKSTEPKNLAPGPLIPNPTPAPSPKTPISSDLKSGVWV